MQTANIKETNKNPFELCDEHTSAIIDGAEVTLSPDEYAILKLIKQADGAIVHMHQIRNAFEHHRKSDALFLNKTVNNLKHKLGKGGKIIESILGIGYRLRIAANNNENHSV